MTAASRCEWTLPSGEPGLVSVLLPVYNRAERVADALDSVWNQTYRPIELIVVDDGSADGTADAVWAWGASVVGNGQGAEGGRRSTENGWEVGDGQFRLRYVYQENAGAPAARNRGVRESHGEFIQFLDSDDELHPERFEKLVPIVQSEGCDTVHSGFERRCGNCGTFLGRYIPPQTDNALETCLQGNLWINTFDFLDRRSLIARVGPWDESLICAQDLDYSYRRLLNASSVGILQESLYTYDTFGADRISTKRQSPEGWQSRLHAEARLSQELMSGNHGVSTGARNAYATDLYAVGVKLHAAGLASIGQQYAEVAGRLEAPPVPLALKRMRALCNAGPFVCRPWVAARELERKLKQAIGKEGKPHRCSVGDQRPEVRGRNRERKAQMTERRTSNEEPETTNQERNTRRE